MATVVPVVFTSASLFPLYSVFWGSVPAIMILVFRVILSPIRAEVLLFNCRKIPFTCSFQSGKANITALGVFCWFAFATYAYTMAPLERRLEDGARRAVWRKDTQLARGFSTVFEDGASPEVQTLGLSA